MDVRDGEVFGIAGPNGSGKTTLINTITHLIAPNGGEIFFYDHAIHRMNSFKICHLGIARTFQIPEIFGSLSVMDNLLLGSIYGMRHEKSIQRKDHIRGIINFVGLKGRESRPAGSLIISEQKRLMIAIALATGPRLLILDEPTAGLTAIESKDMIVMIDQINKQGITVVLIEHNMKVLMGISDRVMIMNHGVKVCEGTPDDVSNDEAVIEMYLGRKYRKEARYVRG
jgi:branched-chain amino acid transport system ATP-binding protein